MKYFLDTEFIEGFKKPLFGKDRHFIDLISIGIIAEDGRTYYAISNEFNYNDADEWVKKNVITPMYINEIHGDSRNRYDVTNFHNYVGISNDQIRKEIIEFINPKIQDLINVFTRHDSWMEEYYRKEFAYIRNHNTKIPDHYYKSGSDGYVKNRALIYNQPEFYGYYADYDWVLLCSLFGRMVDLPKGFPMYCHDLKQSLDNHALSAIAMQTIGESKDLDKGLKFIKSMADYPIQKNNHNALADAKWNYELYKFLHNT